VRSIKPGQFVIGSFFASDNTCPHCHHGYQSSCQHKEFVGGAQAPLLRVPLADGTLVATPDVPADDLVPSLLATSDVLGTGWFAADAANVKPGMTVAVVGDGAVGLLGVLSAKQMGAERIIAMSGHPSRQKLAREFGATDIVTERGDAGVERIVQMTKGIGADAVLECVGTQESMMQAIRSTRPGGGIGYVGVPHGVELNGEELFYEHVRLHGGLAPVRRYLPDLVGPVWSGKINPGRVFDLTLPLDQVAEGYRAMDERRAIKTLKKPLAGPIVLSAAAVLVRRPVPMSASAAPSSNPENDSARRPEPIKVVRVRLRTDIVSPLFAGPHGSKGFERQVVETFVDTRRPSFDICNDAPDKLHECHLFGDVEAVEPCYCVALRGVGWTQPA